MTADDRVRLAIGEWLLDGQPFPECEDPAELLARCAAYHGRFAIEAHSGNYAGLLTDELAGQDADRARLFLAVRADPDALLAGHRARLAWRYARAAVVLLRFPLQR